MLPSVFFWGDTSESQTRDMAALHLGGDTLVNGNKQDSEFPKPASPQAHVPLHRNLFSAIWGAPGQTGR